MSFSNMYPEEWLRRFFGKRMEREGLARRGFFDAFSGFEEMKREMERMFQEQFKDIETKLPKELVREYQTPEGSKVKEVGPIVYGYSMTIGPDGKPKINEFGNVRPSPSGFTAIESIPTITAEREPLVDITTTDKDVKVVVELPGVKKEDIKINAYDSSVEISTTENAQRRYHRVIALPPEADTEVAKSNYNNGILEIAFSKKKETKPKGKEIRID